MLADRWGVTDDEVAMPFPCDDHVPRAEVRLWRGVAVGAPPDAVWPWVRQVRVAPYSYDWVDNLGRRSPRRLLDVPDPRPGEPFVGWAGGRRTGLVLSTEAGRHVTGRVMGAVMSYVVAPAPGGSRLLLKIVLPRRSWWSTGLAVGDLVMARKQLLTWKELAEGA